jgi:hypothetical protein
MRWRWAATNMIAAALTCAGCGEPADRTAETSPTKVTDSPRTTTSTPDPTIATTTTTTTINTTTPTTTAAPPNSGDISTGPSASDPVIVPLQGGDVIEPRPLTFVNYGDGPGELVLQNGEFLIPMALLPEHIVLFEDEPFSGLTGRVLLFDRNGVWLRDVTVDNIRGSTVYWISVAPNGILFVAVGNEASGTLHAFQVTGEDIAPVQSVPTGSIIDSTFAIVTGGVEQSGGGRIMEIETNVALDETSLHVDVSADEGTSVVSVQRLGILDSGAWTVIEEVDPARESPRGTPRSGLFGDGAWLVDVAADDPVLAQPFLVLLSIESASRWYRLGPWQLNASDSQRLVFSRTIVDGLQIAVLDS